MNKLVRIAVMLLALSVMAISGYKLLEIYTEYDEGEKVYTGALTDFVIWEQTADAAEEDVSNAEPDRVIGGPQHDPVERYEDAFVKKVPVEIDFKALTKMYPNVIGWIYCEGTPINYPIMQAEDNDYYLYRTYNDVDNNAGSIYADFRNASDLSDMNTLIYGHNMKNDTMFGTLKDYYDQEYYDKHPVMWILTPNKNYRLDLIAGKIVDVYSDVYTLFEDEGELREHIDWLQKKSSFITAADLSNADRVVTLSTCTSAGDDSERYVIVGSLVEVE